MSIIKKRRLSALVLIIVLLAASLSVGCSSNTEDLESNTTTTNKDTAISTSVNGSESTHSNEVDPNYEIVFNQSEVLEFNIRIDSTDWQAMQDDLQDNLSSGKTEKAGGDRQARPDRQAGEVGDAVQLDEMRPVGEVGEAGQPGQMRPEGEAGEAGKPDEMQPVGEAGEAGEVSESTSNPIWVESSITFDDTTWDHVGIRFKGNSSLKSAFSSGNGKLSFKLDFDEFEEEYPEIENQRFYGFKQLNLNNNYSDESLMHEKVAADLFREFGLASSETTFCVVNVDYGEGSQFFGVYALVEEMDDTGIEEQFDDDSGNLYKPEGTAATFAAGTFNESDMNKKNNEEEDDYSDVLALYEALHDPSRESDVTSWKTHLESVFNVDGFIKWLAVNTTMQNWDTYGNMNHNYYLYNDPETGLLNWIPWDNNEAFSDGKGKSGTLSLELDEVNEKWPLIRYLIDDPEYKTVYDEYLQQFVDEVFTEEKMTETYSDYYQMIKEYAYDERSGYSYIKSDKSFDSAVEALTSHVAERNAAVQSYLTK